MLSVLADGKPHAREELHGCLPDDLGALANIQRHISAIRKHLLQRGEHVVCELHQGSIHYRWVRLIAVDE